MVFLTLGRRQGDAKVNEMGEESVITSERRFRRATMADLPTMLKIYEHARKLMASNGNPTQWVISSLVRKWFVTMSNRNAPCCLSIRLMARNVCSPSSHCVRHRPTYVNIDGAWLDDDPYATITGSPRRVSPRVRRRTASTGASNITAMCARIRIPTTRPCSMCSNRMVSRAAA